MGEAVTYRVEDGVAWLVIDRPEARNAINRAVADGLWAGFRRFQQDQDAAVLVLTGRPQDAWLATWSRADAAVPHPIDPLLLAEAVNRLLASRVPATR